jgi:hypothetical protein
MSERRACQLVNQPRGTQRRQPTQRDDEDALPRAIITLASQYGRYGYRRITALLQEAGWQVGKDRVERIWRRELLQIRRAWLLRLWPDHRILGNNHMSKVSSLLGNTSCGSRCLRSDPTCSSATVGFSSGQPLRIT